MSLRLTLGLVFFASAFAGFVQGAGLLASPPATPAALDERPREIEDVARAETATRFWKPAASTASEPDASLRQRRWTPNDQGYPFANSLLAAPADCGEVETATC